MSINHVDPAKLLDLAEELLDAQAGGHKLTAAEESFLHTYGTHIFTGPTKLPNPTMIEPGPAKVEILARRMELGQQLWNKPYDAKLAEEEEMEYDPIIAGGNFRQIDRRFEIFREGT